MIIDMQDLSVRINILRKYFYKVDNHILSNLERLIVTYASLDDIEYEVEKLEKVKNTLQINEQAIFDWI